EHPRPPLLYLPGLDGTGRLLHRQAALGRTYCLACLSYPQDRNVTYDELADAAAGPLLEQGAGQTAAVPAGAFGGGVALTLALRRPDLVGRMVLCNAFAWFPRRALLRGAFMLAPFLPGRPARPSTRRWRGRLIFSRDITPEERQAWWERTA